MTTKEQERKALEQIRKIVEGLGEDSYIGTAFEGCFEIAEENINNDWACSMKQRVEMNERECEAAEDRIKELEGLLEAANTRAEDAENLFNSKTKAATSYYSSWKDAEDKAITNWNKFREQEDRADALEQEIIKLKAKLYDAMVGA